MKKQPFGIGNQVAQAELASVLHSGGGSFLLLGPAGVGKRTIAQAFAKTFTCLIPKESEPCGQCDVCRLRSTLPKVNILEPATRPLSIDAVRALKAGLSMRPFIGDRRAVLLDEFETATEEAQNALLKILEEPPAGVVFLLIVSDSGSVLPTVQSRTRIIKFQPVPLAEISTWLTSQSVPSQEADRISQVALGRPGLAHRLFNRTSTYPALSALQLFSTAKRFKEIRAAIAAISENTTENDWLNMVADWLLSLRRELITLATNDTSNGQALSITVKLMRRLIGIARQLRRDSGAPTGLLIESFIAILP